MHPHAFAMCTLVLRRERDDGLTDKMHFYRESAIPLCDFVHAANMDGVEPHSCFHLFTARAGIHYLHAPGAVKQMVNSQSVRSFCDRDNYTPAKK
jgi:hypothetical protein